MKKERTFGRSSGERSDGGWFGGGQFGGRRSRRREVQGRDEHHNHHNHHTGVSSSSADLCVPCCMLNAPTVLRTGAELVWFAHGGDMSKCLLLRPWQLRHTTVRSRTPPHGARRQAPRPERERSASSTTAYGHRSDLSRGCGQHHCRRCCRRLGCSGTPWSRGSCTRLTCRSSTLLCHKWWNTWWISSRIWTSRCPRRSSKCPRSHKILSLSALWTSFRRWRNSWWKCRPC